MNSHSYSGGVKPGPLFGQSEVGASDYDWSHSKLRGRLRNNRMAPGWDFDITRLDEAYGWTSMIVWACVWIVPFWVLLGERPKKTPWIVGPVAAIVMLGLWLERNLLIWPSVIKDEPLAWLGPIQLGIAVGFAGAFALVFLVYSRVFPSLAVSVKDS